LVTDAEGSLECGHIAVTEALHQVVIFDQAIGELLGPADAGVAISLQLQVGDVEYSHSDPT
jgi:hypothetical protein